MAAPASFLSVQSSRVMIYIASCDGATKQKKIEKHICRPNMRVLVLNASTMASFFCRASTIHARQ